MDGKRLTAWARGAMATIHDLPLELLGDIIQLVEPPGALVKIALVCRDWRDPAQRALFGTITLGERERERRGKADERARSWLASEARSRFRTTSLGIGPYLSSKVAMSVAAASPALLSLRITDSWQGGHSYCKAVGGVGA